MCFSRLAGGESSEALVCRRNVDGVSAQQGCCPDLALAAASLQVPSCSFGFLRYPMKTPVMPGASRHGSVWDIKTFLRLRGKPFMTVET